MKVLSTNKEQVGECLSSNSHLTATCLSCFKVDSFRAKYCTTAAKRHCLCRLKRLWRREGYLESEL